MVGLGSPSLTNHVLLIGRSNKLSVAVSQAHLFHTFLRHVLKHPGVVDNSYVV